MIIQYIFLLLSSLVMAQQQVDPIPDPKTDPKKEEPKKLTAYWATLDMLTLGFDTNRTTAQREEQKNRLKKKGIPDIPMVANIKGQEILDLIGSTPLKDGEKIPQDLLNQAVTLVTLDRVIDYYGKKSGIADKQTFEYAHYAALAVLTKNAIFMKKIEATQVDATRLNKEQMYAWFKERAGGNVVRLKIDWKYAEGAIGKEKPGDAESWPEARFYFEKLPETVWQFTSEIDKQLQPIATSVRRFQIWSLLLNVKNPALSRNFRGEPNYTEIKKLYDVIKMGVVNPKFDLADEQIRQALANHIKKNKQTFMVREVIHALLKETAIMGQYKTDMDPKWPSLQLDSGILTNSLFVETTYPGESVAGGRFGKAHLTTLGVPEQFNKVMTLNGDLLDVLFN